MSPMFNGLSVLIWSMIAAKARTGMNAASNGEIKTVGSALQQAGALILMIAVASGINIWSQMDNANMPNPYAQHPVVSPASGKTLQSGHG